MNKTHRTYDFETILDRSGTGSVKWEQMKSDNPNVGRKESYHSPSRIWSSRTLRRLRKA